MKLKLSKNSMGMLNLMVRLPVNLAGGLRTMVEKIKPYKAQDDVASREVGRIARWLEKQFKDKSEPPAYEGKIEQRYVDRMKDIAKHYEEVGRSSYLVQEYVGLLDELEGKEADGEGIEETTPEGQEG